jgi:hypothetical protein
MPLTAQTETGNDRQAEQAAIEQVLKQRLGLGNSILPRALAAYAERLAEWEAWEQVSNAAMSRGICDKFRSSIRAETAFAALRKTDPERLRSFAADRPFTEESGAAFGATLYCSKGRTPKLGKPKSTR